MTWLYFDILTPNARKSLFSCHNNTDPSVKITVRLWITPLFDQASYKHDTIYYVTTIAKII